MEWKVIYIGSHSLIGLSCFLIVCVLSYVMYRKPAVFQHPWFVGSVGVWLGIKGLVHVYNIATFLSGHSYVMTLVLLAINAVASAISAIGFCAIMFDALTRPTVKDYKATNDALAEKLGETVRAQEEKH